MRECELVIDESDGESFCIVHFRKAEVCIRDLGEKIEVLKLQRDATAKMLETLNEKNDNLTNFIKFLLIVCTSALFVLIVHLFFKYMHS